MFAFDNPFETKKEIHPTTDYSNVTPRIDTGLSQIRQVGKFTSTGLPVLDDTHHPLTIGSRFKPFNYDNYRAKRQSRINDVTNRLYNNLGSIKHIRHLYSPASQQHHGLMQMMPPGIGGKDRTEIKVLPPAAATATPIPSSNVGVKPAVVAAASPFRAPGGGGTQSDHRPHHAFQATVTSRYAQNRGSGYGSMGQNKFGAPNSTAPTTITTGKKYRPSQLLPIHIPGPKHENIYIGTYTEEVERESGKNTRESGVPMKSRKR
ncbi:uncharacterized protein LOC118434445 [Folsomia candida]|nr:uncharacterized protein LOC118434445 [Folsomia candida]